jgi:hypothetical protein
MQDKRNLISFIFCFFIAKNSKANSPWIPNPKEYEYHFQMMSIDTLSRKILQQRLYEIIQLKTYLYRFSNMILLIEAKKT